MSRTQFNQQDLCGVRCFTTLTTGRPEPKGFTERVLKTEHVKRNFIQNQTTLLFHFVKVKVTDYATVLNFDKSLKLCWVCKIIMSKIILAQSTNA